MHNRESAEASSPELARSPLPALLISGVFPPLFRLRLPPHPPPSPPPPLSACPAGQGRGKFSGVSRTEGGRLRAKGAAEHRSRCPGPRRCPAGAAGGTAGSAASFARERRRRRRERGAAGGPPLSELLVAWPPFRAGGLILPAGTTQPRRLVEKGVGGRLVQRSAPPPRPPSAAPRGARCPNGSEVPPGRGRRRSWAGGRGTQGLTAPRPGGAVKVHGLQMLFRPRCLPF